MLMYSKMFRTSYKSNNCLMGKGYKTNLQNAKSKLNPRGFFCFK